MNPRMLELIRLFIPGALPHRQEYPPDYLERLIDFSTAFNGVRDILFVGGLAQPTSPKSKVLDFGCGTGQLADYLTYTGAEVTGVDINEMTLHYARLEHPKVMFLNGLPPLGRWYDVIVTTHTLGHVDNPLEVLRDLHMRLVANGRLVVLVPNRNQTLLRWIPNVLKGYEPDATILRHWSPRSLKRLVERAGFQVDEYGAFGEPYVRTRSRAFVVARRLDGKGNV